MSQRSFRALLTERQQAARSLVCVGLDPLLEKAPKPIQASLRNKELAQLALTQWMNAIVDATAPFASMFKPQHAHWEAIPGGVEALKTVIKRIRDNYPTIPVFMDCKRGDIDRTQKQYAVAHLDLELTDGMNFNGYMGKDTLKSLIDAKRPGRALVGLGRTSNKEAWEIQDAKMADGRPVWEFMVEKLFAWSTELGVLEDAGIVMGAAHDDPQDPGRIYHWHLSRARDIVGEKMWFLIPGIGTQGGYVTKTIKAAYRGPGTIAINSSSGIIFASQEADYMAAAAAAAEKLRDEIHAAIAS